MRRGALIHATQWTLPIIGSVRPMGQFETKRCRGPHASNTYNIAAATLAAKRPQKAPSMMSAEIGRCLSFPNGGGWVMRDRSAITGFRRDRRAWCCIHSRATRWNRLGSNQEARLRTEAFSFVPQARGFFLELKITYSFALGFIRS
jgi:hypothetical protein